MVGPIFERRPQTREGRELARQEVAKRGASNVDIAAVAIDEIHRHIERIIDVALEAHAGLERERQQPGAVGIGVAPHLGAVGLKAIGPAVGEGRVGEQSGRHRLEREAGAHLGDHVGLVAEIHVHLHGGGAEHHVEPAGSADM